MIPETLRPIYEFLFSEVFRLHVYLNTHERLFNSDEKQDKLLSSTAPTFFRNLEWMLQDSIVLAISRLTDPATQRGGKYQNAVFEQLAEQADNIDEEFRAELTSVIATLYSKCEPLKLVRNKQLAHHDLTTAMKTIVPLVQFEPTNIRSILNSMFEIIGKINTHFDEPPPPFYFADLETGVEALTKFLEMGLKTRQDLLERVWRRSS